MLSDGSGFCCNKTQYHVKLVLQPSTEWNWRDKERRQRFKGKCMPTATATSRKSCHQRPFHGILLTFPKFLLIVYVKIKIERDELKGGKLLNKPQQKIKKKKKLRLA